MVLSTRNSLQVIVTATYIQSLSFLMYYVVIEVAGSHCIARLIVDSVFMEDDDSPIWMTPEERLLNKNDRLTGETKETDKQRSQTLKNIAQAGLQLPRRRFSVKDLRRFTSQHGIATTYQKQLKEPGNTIEIVRRAARRQRS